MKKLLFNTRKLFAISLSIFVITSGSQISSAKMLEEILVTAQKRSQSLQDVPITITAFSAQGLEKGGIKSTDDLSLVTPGLQMGRQIGSASPFLRGIGTQNSSAGDEGSIATYVDGVYIINMLSQAQSFNNIERIEVLKGPQGTLFGRNATGGLIHIITKDPSYESSGSLELSYDEFETLGVSLYGTTAIGEKVAADIAINYSDQGEGWGVNVATGKEIGLSEVKSVRSKWLFDINEKTQAILSLDYAEKMDSTAIARQLAPGALGVDGAFIFGGCLAAGGDQAACAAAGQAGASKNTGHFHDINADADPLVEEEQFGGALKITHSFDSMDIMSLTAYRESESLQRLDQEATPVSVVTADLGTDTDFFSQEIQVQSTTDDALEWIAGLYYLQSTSSYNDFDVVGVALAPLLRFIGEPSQDTTSYAVFAQGTYAIGDATNLTVGLRWSKDERELKVKQSFDVGVIVPGPSYTKKKSWAEPTWRLSLDHQFSDNTLLFASLSRGFKSGVYNLAGILAGEAGVGPVDPEILDSIEVGLKTDLLDGSMRLNAAIFHYQYDDMQLSRISDASTLLFNAAEAEVTGAEIDLTALISDQLTLTMGVSVLDSEYTSFPDATITTPSPVGGNTSVSGDVASNSLIRSPELTVNVGVNYIIPSNSGEYGVHINYYYNDGFFWEVDNRLEQESYDVVNAEISWTTNDETWGARLYGRNLTGAEYSYFSNSDAALGDFVSAAAPSTIGIAIKYNF